MFSGADIARALSEVGVSHVLWLPDSATGQWEAALDASPAIELVRVARESEAWAIAGGLAIGGKQPIVVIQSTGLFDSGDALRNMLFDWNLPLYAIVGHRSYLTPDSTDTARQFAEPILTAWGIDYRLIERSEQLAEMVEHIRACRASGKPGAALLAEGV